MSTPPKINGIVLYTQNMEGTRTFYESLGFHFVQERHHDGPHHYACETEMCVLEIYPAGKDGKTAGKKSGETRLSFSVDALEAKINALETQGVKIRNAELALPDKKNATVYDPDGRLIDLVEK